MKSTINSLESMMVTLETVPSNGNTEPKPAVLVVGVEHQLSRKIFYLKFFLPSSCPIRVMVSQNFWE